MVVVYYCYTGTWKQSFRRHQCGRYVQLYCYQISCTEFQCHQSGITTQVCILKKLSSYRVTSQILNSSWHFNEDCVMPKFYSNQSDHYFFRSITIAQCAYAAWNGWGGGRQKIFNRIFTSILTGFNFLFLNSFNYLFQFWLDSIPFRIKSPVAGISGT